MVDISTKPAIDGKWLATKQLEINMTQAGSEPILTLEYLGRFLESIIDGIDARSTIEHRFNIENPAPKVLLIKVNNDSILEDRYAFIADLKQAYNQIQLIRSAIFPDDLVSFVGSIRFWLENQPQFKDKLGNWSVSVASLRSSLSQAAQAQTSESHPLDTFTSKDLKDAVEELIAKINDILGDKTQQEFASVDDFLSDIEQDWRRAWNEGVSELITTFTNNASLITKEGLTVLSTQKVYLATDYRRVINALIATIEKDLDKTDEPWNRIRQQTKDDFFRIDSFSSRLNEVFFDISDFNKASAVVRIIRQILQELAVEKEAAVASEEADEDTDDGGDTEPSKDITELIEFQQVLAQLKAQLPHQVGLFLDQQIKTAQNLEPEERAEFEAQLALLSPEQNDWLMLRVNSLIQEWVTQDQFSQLVQQFLSDKLDSETNLYAIDRASIDRTTQALAAEFINTYQSTIEQLVATIPTTEEARAKQVEIEKEIDQAVVQPIAETADQVTAPAPLTSLEREKQVAQIRTAFLGEYFNGYSENDLDSFDRAFLQQVNQYIRQNAGEAELSPSDKARIILGLFTNENILKTSNQFYLNQFVKLGLDDPKILSNIQNTTYSLLVLTNDPWALIENIQSLAELKEMFGIDVEVDLATLKKLLINYTKIQFAFYRQHPSGIQLKSWHDDPREVNNNEIANTREFIKAFGADGVLLVNADQDGLESLVNEEYQPTAYDYVWQETWQQPESETDTKTNKKSKKRKLKAYERIRQEIWRQMVADKSNQELLIIYADIYNIYEITPEQLESRVAPEFFSLSDLAIAASGEGNLGTQQEAVNKHFGPKGKLAKKASAALGKAALTLIAPEVMVALKPLENLPIIGEQIKKIEEKVGQIIAVAGAALGALIALLTKSIYALIGSLGGGIIGGLIGGPVGVAIGIPVGAGLGLLTEKLFAGGGLGAGIDTATGLLSGGQSMGVGGVLNTVAASATNAVQILAVTGVTITTGFIMTNLALESSFIHPTTNSLIGSTGYGQQSLYVTIIKTPSPNTPGQDPQPITYTVTILANKGYDITILDIKDTTRVRFKDNSNTASVADRGINDFGSDLAGQTIVSGQQLELSYEVEYGSEFDDAAVVNTFTLSFTYASASDSGDSVAQTLAVVGFGDYPKVGNCFPTHGEITQLPFGSYSHRSSNAGYGADALDIAIGAGTPVSSLWSGTITTAQSGGDLGTHVIIKANDGTNYLLAHFSQMGPGISVGTSVTPGQIVGYVGSTGHSSGNHLHYERFCGEYYYSCPLNSISQLLVEHLATEMVVGDFVEACY